MSRRNHRKDPTFITYGDLTIPSDKPDIEFLLRVTATPTIEQAVVAARQISFSGNIDIFTEYVACVPNGTQPIAFIRFKRPFEGIFSHRYAHADMNSCLKGEVSIQKLEVVSPRTITISINIKVHSVKLTPARKPLPLHFCKPCLINFFETNNPGIYLTQNPHVELTNQLDFCTEQTPSPEPT